MDTEGHLNTAPTSQATESGKRTNSWKAPVQWLIIGCLTVAIVSLFLDTSIPAWYDALRKPFFDLPGWLFALAWPVFYGCMAVAGWLIWRMPPTRLRTHALMLFSIQFMLNLLWLMDFFYYHVIGPALLLIVLLWAATLLTTVRFRQLKRVTVYLMGPYLVWITFTFALNLEIALLN